MSRATGPGVEASRPRPSALPNSATVRAAWKAQAAAGFTGGPGTGKSRAAIAIARLYRDLGVLEYGT